ncbi:protein-export chaperone SecB [Clostridium tyrobutyricum]|uniref:protein-export chaperone SecB n=1 Tax=Clostridium tyrobutyricum TaxID=1519 RepID=UPI001C387C41|nr:protein-export chaperone SecB [Clostridium tyrobutyricum]MBV4439314.1 protein-export chaperone SecB [Clostridium tyrobutyricum]
MSSTSIDKKIYSNLIDGLKIQNIYLNDLKLTNVNREIKGNSLSVKLDCKLDKIRNIKEKDGILEVFPNFSIQAFSDEDVLQVAFNIDIQFYIRYNIKNLADFEKIYIDTFINQNIPLNIWPYLREIISSLSTRIGFPALVIDPFTIKR